MQSETLAAQSIKQINRSINTHLSISYSFRPGFTRFITCKETDITELFKIFNYPSISIITLRDSLSPLQMESNNLDELSATRDAKWLWKWPAIAFKLQEDSSIWWDNSHFQRGGEERVRVCVEGGLEGLFDDCRLGSFYFNRESESLQHWRIPGRTWRSGCFK